MRLVTPVRAHATPTTHPVTRRSCGAARNVLASHGVRPPATAKREPVPLYKNGVLVGAIGISGDGIDQDDLIAAAGANIFAPPAAIRSDQIFVRGVRLPFLKFPRSPNL